MIKNVLYCDRCGKKCEEWRNNNGRIVHRRKFFRKFFLESAYEDEGYLDLCQDCYDSLDKWMKAGKEKAQND